MPFKHHAGLRQRGSLTIWFNAEAVQAWRAAPRTTRGGLLGRGDRDGANPAGAFPLGLPADRRVDRLADAAAPRDRHIQAIAETGRIAWQRMSGHNARAKAEAAIARYKQVIGDRRRAHSDDGRRTELIVASTLLNRMFGLVRPTCVRVA